MPKRILTKVKFAQPPSWSAGCLSSPATSWTRSASSSHSTRPLETFSSRLLTITMHYLYNQRDNLDWKLLEKTEMELIEFNQTGLNWPQRDLTMRWFRLWHFLQATTLLGYLNSCLNPIIYTIFNPGFIFQSECQYLSYRLLIYSSSIQNSGRPLRGSLALDTKTYLIKCQPATRNRGVQYVIFQIN